jgi:hypothetical protein
LSSEKLHHNGKNMSINNKGLTVLRNVREILVGQFSDLDLVSLAALGEGGRSFERIALMLDTIAPLLLRFGRIVDESSGYINRQKSSAKRFRIMVTFIMCLIVFACFGIIYSFRSQPGEWYTRATYFLAIISICVVIIGFLRVMHTMVDDRTARVMGVSNTELHRYKVNLSDNLFVKFANARLRGAEGIKDFKQDMAALIQQTVEEADMFDFCANQADETSTMKKMCTVISLCDTNATRVTMADVLREHFRDGLGRPCGELLRNLFRTLQDVKDGNKVTNLDQYFLWSQITKGAETFRGLLRWDAQARQELNIDNRQMLKIIDEQVIGVMKLDLVEVADLSLPTSVQGTVVEAEDKAACWKACHDRGGECKWARFQDGRCMVGTDEALPGAVSSVFILNNDPAQRADPSKAGSKKGDDSVVLVRGATGKADDASSSSPALVCGKGMPVTSFSNMNPVVYAGKLTLDVATDSPECTVISFKSPANGVETLPTAITELQKLQLNGYKANEAENYKTLFGESGTVIAPTSTFCTKTTNNDIVKLNPIRLVATYQELEPAIREKIMFGMEKYQYVVNLTKYRSYIMNQLRDHYGPMFVAMSPHLLDTMTEVEKAISAAKQAVSKSSPQYVTVQRFKSRIEGLSSRQRTQFGQVVADMANATYLHQRHFKPVYSDLDLAIMRVMLTHGIVLAVIALVLFFIVTFRCFAEMGCTVWNVARRLAIVCALVMLGVTLFLSSYRKAVVRRDFNRQVSETNGQALVQKTAELMMIWNGSSSFNVYATVITRDTSLTLSDKDGMTLIPVRAGAITEGLQPSTGTLSKPISNVKSLRLTVDTIAGAVVLKVRSVKLMDSQGGFSYVFRQPEAMVVTPGQSIDLPVRQIQSFYKGKSSSTTFDLQVNLSEAVSDYSSVYTSTKQILDIYDKCNSINQSRALPFPILDISVMVAGIIAVLVGLVYLFGVLRPLEKVRNLRTLYTVRRRVEMGDKAPEFESVISCCRTPDDVWERLLNVAVVAVFIFAIYASFTVSNTIGDYRGGLYSSPEYAESKCV